MGIKEAVLKAVGTGLRQPPRGVSTVHNHLRAQPTLSLAPALEDRPNRWRAALFAPAPGWRVAVALRAPTRRALPHTLRVLRID